MDRPYLLEQIDDAAVVQYYADGFEALPLEERLFIWHLYQAAIAGRDIFYDQKYRHAVEMREILEEVLTHPDGIDADALAEIRRYTKLFWIHSGPHNSTTSRKFVLKCSPAAFQEAVENAARNGATLPLEAGESIAAMLTRLGPAFFDASVDSHVTNKTPEGGRDILQASANNLYDGVTMADLEGFREQYGLNSRLAKRNGALVEEVYRAGGRYGAQIDRIVEHLRAALEYAPGPTREARRRCITRGSAADSLVCYCLGISNVCPIRFGLYFRRFLNKERMALHKLPDIDIDFAHDRKDDVVKIIFDKYGREHCAVVGGFSTFQARSAFADVAKVLGLSEHQVRRFTEHFPWSFGSSWEPAGFETPRLVELLRESLLARVLASDSSVAMLDRLADEVASRRRDPYSAVEEIIRSAD